MSTWAQTVCAECGCVIGLGKWELHQAWHRKIAEDTLYPQLVLTPEGVIHREATTAQVPQVRTFETPAGG